MTEPDFLALLQKDEELHPDLRPYVVPVGAMGLLMVNHKYVQEIGYIPGKAARINYLYHTKKKLIEEAKQEKNWFRVLGFTERPYRLEMLLELAEIGARESSEWWEMIRFVWTDTENAWQNKRMWRVLWNDVDAANVMTEEEKETLAKMPEEIVLWRGMNNRIQMRHNNIGFSWTNDKKKAVWFARRFQGVNRGSILLKTIIKKDKVIAYLDSRETEFIVSPQHIENLHVTRLKRRPLRSPGHPRPGPLAGPERP